MGGGEGRRRGEEERGGGEGGEERGGGAEGEGEKGEQRLDSLLGCGIPSVN